MTVAGFASIVGSPGVTTWATLVTSAAATIAHRKDSESMAKDSVLFEVDPAGSKVVSEYRLADGSFLGFASDFSGSVDWREHAQLLPGGGNVISVNGSAKTISNLIETSLSITFDLLADDDTTLAIADLGRLYLGSPVLSAVDGLDSLIVLLNRVNSDIVLSSRNIRELVDLSSGLQVGWGVVGKHGQSNQAIEEFSGIEVLVEIPEDAMGAAALFDKPSKWILQRSNLSRAAYSFAERLLTGALVTGSTV